MSDRKSKIAKIRKCLALSKSSNEHEAASALAMAAKLMAELGIDDADAGLFEVSDEAARGSRALRPALWECILAASVSQALGAYKIIDDLGDWRFLGRGAVPEIAAYAFQVLYRQLKAARAEYIRTKLRRCKVGRKRTRADVFCEGWSRAVFMKVKKLAPEREPDALVEQYLALHFPDLVPAKRREAKLKGCDGDFYNGVAGGHAIDLSHGVGAAAPQPLIGASR